MRVRLHYSDGLTKHNEDMDINDEADEGDLTRAAEDGFWNWTQASIHWEILDGPNAGLTG